MIGICMMIFIWCFLSYLLSFPRWIWLLSAVILYSKHKLYVSICYKWYLCRVMRAPCKRFFVNNWTHTYIIVATRSFTQLCDHQAAFSGLRIAYCVNLRVGTIIIEVYAISALLFTELGTFYLSPNGIECWLNYMRSVHAIRAACT